MMKMMVNLLGLTLVKRKLSQKIKMMKELMIQMIQKIFMLKVIQNSKHQNKENRVQIIQKLKIILVDILNLHLLSKRNNKKNRIRKITKTKEIVIIMKMIMKKKILIKRIRIKMDINRKLFLIKKVNYLIFLNWNMKRSLSRKQLRIMDPQIGKNKKRKIIKWID